jgi:hypothetical protein
LITTLKIFIYTYSAQGITDSKRVVKVSVRERERESERKKKEYKNSKSFLSFLLNISWHGT